MAFDDGIKTVSGSIAHTDDAAAKVPFVSVKCGIKPTLSGVSALNETQTGRNIMPNEKVQGASTRVNIGQTDDDYSLHLKAGTYTLSATSLVQMRAYYRTSTGGSNVLIWSTYGTSGSGTFTLSEDSDVRIWLYNSDGLSVSDIQTFQLEVGSTAHAYEPYNPTTYTASLGRTIYGGQADIVNGVGTETYKYIDLSTISTWYLENADNFFSDVIADAKKSTSPLCNSFPSHVTFYQQGVDGIWISGSGRINFTLSSIPHTAEALREYLQNNQVYIVYELATPTDFTFTPITPTPETVGKVNNVYCNTGDTELTYYDNAHGFTEVTVNKTGKNLFDISKVATTGTTAGISWSVSGNEITISGTATSSGWKTFVEFKLPHKGTYHFHMNATGNVGYFLRGWTQLVGKDVTEVCNDPSQVYRVAINNTVSGQSYSGTISKIQIELGSQATEYEPYEAVSKTAYLHKVIYGGTADVIRGTCEPKNLFNEDWEVGGINDATGLPNSETNKIRSKTFSSIKGGATCYVGVPKNIRVLFYASDESFISETANIMNSTFTTPVNCSLFKIRGTVDYGTTYNDNIIICYGSSASEYVPHFEPFTFPPISMSTDEGENTLFANEGASAITYRKETD